MLGLFVYKGFSCTKDSWVASYGSAKPVLFSEVCRRFRQFVCYAITIPDELVLKTDLKKPASDDYWVLIPDFWSKGAYVFGKKVPSRPTENLAAAVGLDGTHKGALFNTRLPGESAHVTWRVTPPSPANGGHWEVNFFAVKSIKAWAELELLTDYGPLFVSAIEDDIGRAAIRGSKGVRIVSGTRVSHTKKPVFIGHRSRNEFMSYIRESKRRKALCIK